jgi:hypothetical protein
MSPALTMDTMLPSSNSTLFNIPKLADDGLNWITYKGRMLTALGARGLMRYTDGRKTKPIPFAVDLSTGKVTKPDGTKPTDAELEDLEDKIDEYQQKDSLVKQQIFSTISDQLLLRIQNLGSAAAIWDKVCKIHKGKTELVHIDLRRRLQELRCEEGGDVKAHFGEQLRLRELLAGMGASIEDRDFYAITLGLLPESYRPLVSSINATAKIAKKVLTPYELISVVTEEYEHRLLSDRRTRKKGSNSAFNARVAQGKSRNAGGSNQQNPDAMCTNCDRKGHWKSDCWRKGGGKEGQGPRQKKARQNKMAATAAAATDSQDNYAFASIDSVPMTGEKDSPAKNRTAIIDSGATSHFCPNRAEFILYNPITPLDIRTADGSIISAIGRGDVRMNLLLGSKWTMVTLKDALHVPKMSYMLVATNRITAAGLAVHFEGTNCRILSSGPKRQVIAEIPHVDGLYTVTGQHEHHAALAKEKLTLGELHRVLGHVAHSVVKSAVEKGLVEGVELDSTSEPEFCEACEKGKAAVKQPFPKELKCRVQTYGKLIHTDLWGPAQTVSIGGSSYYMSFTDDFSRKTHILFLKHKSEALGAFKQYEARLTRQHDAKIKTLHSDQGGEYLSADFDEYLAGQGIK